MILWLRDEEDTAKKERKNCTIEIIKGLTHTSEIGLIRFPRVAFLGKFRQNDPGGIFMTKNRWSFVLYPAVSRHFIGTSSALYRLFASGAKGVQWSMQLYYWSWCYAQMCMQGKPRWLFFFCASMASWHNCVTLDRGSSLRVKFRLIQRSFN